MKKRNENGLGQNNYCSITVLGSTYHRCAFRMGTYGKGGALSISVETRDEEGFCEPLLDATINIGAVPKDCVAIKNYSENAGLLDSLLALGVVTEVVETRQSGYVDVPICKFNLEALNKFSI